MNPANFESFIDPNGGEWIRLKHPESVRNIVWRPFNIHITESGAFGFEVEFFDGPGVGQISESNSKDLQNVVNTIMTDMLAMEQAELEAIAESEMDVEGGEVTDDLTSHIQSQEVLAGGHKVSEAMLPQDIQGDLAQISSVLGGLKPQ